MQNATLRAFCNTFDLHLAIVGHENQFFGLFLEWPFYCKLKENLIFANSVKRHICHIKNSQLGHDLPTSVNDGDFAIFLGFYFYENFASARFRKNLFTLTSDALIAFCFLSQRAMCIKRSMVKSN